VVKVVGTRGNRKAISGGMGRVFRIIFVAKSFYFLADFYFCEGRFCTGRQYYGYGYKVIKKLFTFVDGTSCINLFFDQRRAIFLHCATFPFLCFSKQFLRAGGQQNTLSPTKNWIWLYLANMPK
jgi:hypothetical protein